MRDGLMSDVGYTYEIDRDRTMCEDCEYYKVDVVGDTEFVECTCFWGCAKR